MVNRLKRFDLTEFNTKFNSFSLLSTCDSNPVVVCVLELYASLSLGGGCRKSATPPSFYLPVSLTVRQSHTQIVTEGGQHFYYRILKNSSPSLHDLLIL